MSSPESSPAVRPPDRVLRTISLLAPPLALMALIFYLSNQPNLVPTHGFFETLVRKLFHVSEYLVLTLAWWRALRGLAPESRNGLCLAAAAAISIAYAITDEFHQTFITGREGAPRDVVIDTAGVALASLLIVLYARRRRVGPSRPRAA